MGRLLGSCLMAMTIGSHAAAQERMSRPASVGDRMVVEPVKTLNVCDVYGRGFIYLPGGLTCFRPSGFVRYQYNAVGEQQNADGDDYTVISSVRASLDFDFREETEAGLLRGFTRVETTELAGRDADTIVKAAFIQYGNLTAGYLDSLWTAPTAGIRDGLVTVTDWAVGSFRANQVSLIQEFGNVSLGISIEDDGTGDWKPDVVAKLVYSDAWGGAYLAGVYDEQGGPFRALDFDSDDEPGGKRFEGFGEDARSDAFALKSGLSLIDFVLPGSLLKVEGHYAFDPSLYASDNLIDTAAGLGVQSNANEFPFRWAIGLGYGQEIGAIGVALSARYGKTFEVRPAVRPDGFGDGEAFNAAADLSYDIAANLTALGEVAYRRIGLPADALSQTTGLLRVDRRF